MDTLRIIAAIIGIMGLQAKPLEAQHSPCCCENQKSACHDISAANLAVRSCCMRKTASLLRNINSEAKTTAQSHSCGCKQELPFLPTLFVEKAEPYKILAISSARDVMNLGVNEKASAWIEKQALFNQPQLSVLCVWRK